VTVENSGDNEYGHIHHAVFTFIDADKGAGLGGVK
jgi:hypothetical protein